MSAKSAARSLIECTAMDATLKRIFQGSGKYPVTALLHDVEELMLDSKVGTHNLVIVKWMNADLYKLITAFLTDETLPRSYN